MKRSLGCASLIIMTLTLLDCEVVVRPPQGGVVIAPAPPPPVVVVPARPRLVFVPEYRVYVALDVEYDLFYDGSVWFYFSDGRWYRGRDYRGPWVVIKRGLPPGLSRVPPGHLKKRALRLEEVEFEEHDDESDDD